MAHLLRNVGAVIVTLALSATAEAQNWSRWATDTSTDPMSDLQYWQIHTDEATTVSPGQVAMWCSSENSWALVINDGEFNVDEFVPVSLRIDHGEVFASSGVLSQNGRGAYLIRDETVIESILAGFETGSRLVIQVGYNTARIVPLTGSTVAAIWLRQNCPPLNAVPPFDK